MDHLNGGWVNPSKIPLPVLTTLPTILLKQLTTAYILLCLLSIFFLRIILYIPLCSHTITVPFLHCDPALWLFHHSWLVYWTHLLCLCISSSKFFINRWKSKRWLDLKLKKFKAITGYMFFFLLWNVDQETESWDAEKKTGEADLQRWIEKRDGENFNNFEFLISVCS